MTKIMTRSQKDKKNIYITMIDTSFEESMSYEPSPTDVLKNKAEKVEKERDEVRQKLQKCQSELNIKSKEMAVLKRKIKNLQKYEISLNKLKNSNKDMRRIISEKNKIIENIKLEMEQNTEKWEMQLREYQENSKTITCKLANAENCNNALRASYDDVYEKLQVYKSYVEKHLDQSNERPADEGRTNSPEVSKEYKKQNQNAVEKRYTRGIHIIGDEKARGMGAALYQDGFRGVSCSSKPGCRLSDLLEEIGSTMNMLKRGDTLVIVSGNNENSVSRKKFLKHINVIVESARERDICLLISTIKYTRNDKNNQAIYRTNCALYDMASHSNSFSTIDINEDDGQSMAEMISFRLKYPTRVIPNNITIRLSTETQPLQNTCSHFL
jgi:hypothetical protein